MFLAILNYLPDAYPKHIPGVLAGNDLFRSSFGAAFPLFAKAMYDNLGIGWASSTLAFISIAFIPIPFVLWKVCSLRIKHLLGRKFADCGFSLVRCDPEKQVQYHCKEG